MAIQENHVSQLTRVHQSPFENKINPKDSVLFVGSCFSQHIGSHLQKIFKNIYSNPCGIVYNPLSILNCLFLLQSHRVIRENELNCENGIYSHYLFSSHFSHTDPSIACQYMNTSIESVQKNFQQLDFLFLTMGTAWVYELKTTNEVVSNCHKMSSTIFKRRILDVEEIVDKITIFIKNKLLDRPKLKIIFTVSPVRHWKDGAHENTVSKSTLHLAIAKLQNIFPNHVLYFPAYEIQIDELRDYRYYDDDMLHPSNLAIRYIQKILFSLTLSPQSIQQLEEVEGLFSMQSHRVMFKESPAGKDFRKKLLRKTTDLEQKYQITLK